MLKSMRASGRVLAILIIILSLSVCIALTFPVYAARSRRRLVAMLVQRHLQVLNFVCGLKVHVRGRRPLSGRRFLLLSHHVSYWDILALGSIFPLGFVAKDCIAGWPLLGAVIRRCNTLFVNRDDVMARWRLLRALQRRILDLSYCVFPEGTTTAAIAPNPDHWHRGNIAVLRDPGVDIWLAGLYYDRHEELAWIDDDKLLPHLWKVLKEPSLTLMVHLQAFHANEGLSLAEASFMAWYRTSELCHEAQQELSRLAALRLPQGNDQHHSFAL